MHMHYARQILIHMYSSLIIGIYGDEITPAAFSNSRRQWSIYAAQHGYSILRSDCFLDRKDKILSVALWFVRLTFVVCGLFQLFLEIGFGPRVSPGDRLTAVQSSRVPEPLRILLVLYS